MARVSLGGGAYFEPSERGFCDLRNEGFVQKPCLAKAQEVAAIAGGATGSAHECDVRPGKTRCHAQAKCPIRYGDKAWYEGKYSKEAEAMSAAAVQVGGKATYKKKARKR